MIMFSTIKRNMSQCLFNTVASVKTDMGFVPQRTCAQYILLMSGTNDCFMTRANDM